MKKVKEFIIRLIFLTIGPMIAAVALEGFLIPNNMIDGGVVGISIMTSYLTDINLGILLIIINLPFVLLAFQKMGKLFVFNTIYATAMLGIFVNLVANHHHVDDLLLATVYGGILLGIGVGLVLRNSAAMDGTEILAIRLSKKIGFSIGEIIMFFNIFIYTAAGFLYGVQRALYSVLAYFITYKVIDIVLQGFSESKSVNIVSDKAMEIGDAMISQMDIGITYLEGRGGYTGQKKHIIFCVISRLELVQLKQLVKSIDPLAFISVENVHEVEGTRIKPKAMIDEKFIGRFIKNKNKKTKNKIKK